MQIAAICMRIVRKGKRRKEMRHAFSRVHMSVETTIMPLNLVLNIEYSLHKQKIIFSEGRIKKN